MNIEIIQDIIFAILGLVILVVSICINAGIEVVVLGALILVVAVGCFIYQIINKRKNKH